MEERSVNFNKVASKPATFLKLALLHGRFSSFLNCTNGIKIAQYITYCGIRACFDTKFSRHLFVQSQ